MTTTLAVARRFRIAFAEIPGWAWGVTLFIAMLFAPLAEDFVQYYEAARAWPEPFVGVPLVKLNQGYYGIFLPWAVPLFLPVALLPLNVAMALMRTLSMGLLFHLTGRSRWKMAALCLSPVAMSLVATGNIDAIAASGILLSGPAAIILLMMKPQVAGLAMLPVLRRDGWKQLVPMLVIVALSTWLWPEWIERAALAREGSTRLNWSVFPYGIPVALVLLFLGWQRRDPELGALATPFAVPYFAFYSFAPMMAITFHRWPRIGWALWVLSWVLFPQAMVSR
jgi:hypothetical protein